MDAVRYYAALALLVTFLPAMSMWLWIHPLIGFWRRRGPVITYLAVGSFVVVMALGLLQLRTHLLRVEFGFSWPLAIAAVFCLAVAIVIERQYRRHLGFSTLLGLPEVAEGRSDKLITEGIYDKIRHPRYVGILFEVSAFALFANYLAVYVVIIAAVPLLYLIALLEERELLARFGDEYQRYMMRVPRFFPRLQRS